MVCHLLPFAKVGQHGDLECLQMCQTTFKDI